MKSVSPPTTSPPLVGTRKWNLSVRHLTPGYFAFVMATGIVSIGAHLQGFGVLAGTLLLVAVVGYAVLLLLNLWRFIVHRSEMAQDFADPSRAFGFFTFIAATNVIGAAMIGMGYTFIAVTILSVSLLVWLALGYVIPWTAVLGGSHHRPRLNNANGTWFIWAVASQSVAVVAAGLEPLIPELRDTLAVVAVLTWSVGLFLYAVTGILVILRIMLFKFEPQDFDAPYWVAMGAVAISVVAGARIVEMDASPIIDATRGIIAGMSVILWMFAIWLIPVLLAVGVWRHFFRSVPLTYDPTLWSMVFPFGMFAVAGLYLARANHLPTVGIIGAGWFWVALLAWALTTGAMIIDISRRVRSPRSQP